jgi:hypothetical protein
MERRQVLKLMSSAVIVAAPGMQSAGQEQHAPVDVTRIPHPPPGLKARENSPERLIAAEPEIKVSPEGDAVLTWKTVVPTQGATVYLGLPNDEVRLEFPIYSGATRVEEDKPVTDHTATLDLRSFTIRFAINMALSGGVLAYRIEMMDPNRLAARFIDRRFRFVVKNDRYANAVTVIEGPNVALVGERTATVWWSTDLPSRGALEIAGRTIASTSDGTRHVATAEHLEPGKEFPYTIIAKNGDDEFRSRTYSLRTAPQEAEFSFVFTCDGRTGALGGGETALEGINGESARALSTQMDRHRPAFLIFTGDLISGYTTSADDFRAQMRSWKRIYGPLWRWMPIYTGMGNHESLLNDYGDTTGFDKTGNESAESIFADEFLHPQNGPEPEREGLPPYKGAVYSFDYGGCHFVQLNSDYWYSSNPEELGGNYFGRLLPGQLDWFEKDLATARRSGAKHIFVFVHEPAFPNGGHVSDALWGGGVPEGVAARDRFWSAVSAAQVVAVFHGHEHNYSRMRIDAQTPVHRDGSSNPKFTHPVWQIIQGAAGAPFYPMDHSTPWTNSVQKFVTHTWSYCHVSVKGASVKLETFSFTGELLDEVTLT